jgi:hypothetical protein
MAGSKIAPRQRPDTLMQLSRSSILEVRLVPRGRAIHNILALFGCASRANQCPVSGVKQPCRRNLETAEFDPDGHRPRGRRTVPRWWALPRSRLSRRSSGPSESTRSAVPVPSKHRCSSSGPTSRARTFPSPAAPRANPAQQAAAERLDVQVQVRRAFITADAPVSASEIYDWCYAKRRLMLGKPLTTRHRYSVWRILVTIADPVERVPPHGAWLWRLRNSVHLFQRVWPRIMVGVMFVLEVLLDRLLGEFVD